MSCCDDWGNCRQGRDCPARAAQGQCRRAPDGPRGNEPLWELAESAALLLFILIAGCGIAGFVYARFGADIELALWRVADAAWALVGRLS